MFEFNENISNQLSKFFSGFISASYNRRVSLIILGVLSVVTFFVLVSGIHFAAGITNFLGLAFITVQISKSSDKKEYLFYSLINFVKYFILQMGLLTVVLNLELHNIAVYLLVYLLFIGSMSFLVREHLQAINSEETIKDNSNSFAFSDVLFSAALILAIIPVLHNAVIIIYILISTIINNYLLVSDISMLFRVKQPDKETGVVEEAEMVQEELHEKKEQKEQI